MIMEFVPPKREILNQGDMKKWVVSKAYKQYIAIIASLNGAVKGKSISDSKVFTLEVKNILSMMAKIDTFITNFPPIDQPQRFGNKAFKLFYQHLCKESPGLLADCLDPKFHSAIIEIAPYLNESVGNEVRIDYGTGHELSFIMFLLCLFKIGALQEKDMEAAVLNIFNSYMDLVRRLQTVYNMEPAGSHGVWSLDDFQFLPFLFGSSQLIDNPKIQPSSFPEPEIAKFYGGDYMFMASIDHINKVKTGPFSEHSNKLWNISGVPDWKKVNAGLLKMYQAEVLDKFPVAQHILFGNLISIQPDQNGPKT